MPSDQRLQKSKTSEGDSERPTPSRRVLDVNSALREAYDKAVDESIPDEMLQLLEMLK